MARFEIDCSTGMLLSFWQLMENKEAPEETKIAELKTCSTRFQMQKGDLCSCSISF